ncbi:SH3 domain-containing protein [Nostoc sp. CHAB 5715]|nr:SH3 domain-containing protein [Nostoc sp. CHAB 5715]
MPLPTATPTLTSTPISSSTTSLASDSVCRLQPESPESSYIAYVVPSKGLNLRAEPRQDSKPLKLLKFNQRIIILKENENKTWQNICVEGNNLKGWVKANNTKKVVE